MKDQVDELRVRHEQHQANHAELDDTDRSFEIRGRECEELGDEADQAKATLGVADAEYASARDAKQRASERLGQLRRDQATLAQLTGQLADKEKDLDALNAEIHATELLVKQRNTERDATRGQHEAAVRASAARHLAAQCRPGDLCPVCQHPMPETFVAPDIPDETAAKKAWNGALRARALGLV